MERIIALLFCCFFIAPSGWAQIESAEPAPGKIIRNREPATSFVFNRGDVLWSESFENGIPENWSNSEVTGIAQWEYRGPETSPDIYIGSRGSCIPTGAAGSDPIESASWSNGFVIFDSNYWDDNLGPCIDGFGTGPSPAPHDAYLELPEINFDSETDVFIRFHQYFKEWANNTLAYLEYSVAGGEWTNFYQLSIDQGNATEPDAVVSLNISEFAALQSDVRIRFHFEGTYYYWMIDDIEFYVPDQNDVVITNTSTGDFDIYDPDNETGFENLEYTMFPDDMPPYFEFEAEVFNAGSQPQTDVSLHVEIENLDTEEIIYSESSLNANMISQQLSFMTTTAFNMPAVIGEYVVRYSISQLEEEEVPEDNIYEYFFNINDVTYARDYRSTTGIYAPQSQFWTTPYEMGNMFLVTAADMELHSLSVGVGLGVEPGTSIYGALYRLDINNFNDTELLTQTPDFDVYAEAQNNIGDNKTMVVPFDEPITLYQDSAYLVVAGVPSGAQDVLFATSGAAEPLTSWVRFMPNSWYYMEENPLVRMNFGEVVGIEEITQTPQVTSQIFPNPWSESATVQFCLKENSDVRILVHDYLGRKAHELYVGNLPAGTHTQEINRGPLVAGLYTYTLLVNDKFSSTQSMIVTE